MKQKILRETSRKAIQVFHYLTQLKTLKKDVTSDIKKLCQDIVWFKDIPSSPYVSAVLEYNGTPTGIMLEVKKVSLPPVPTPPSDCKGWIVGGYKNHKKEPVLKELFSEAFEDDEGNLVPETYLIKEQPEVVSTWKRYLEQYWRPWAARCAERAPVVELYRSLFRMHTALKREGEKLEVLFSIGLVRSKSGNKTYNRHICSYPVQIDFDALNGIIAVRLNTESGGAIFESDWIEELFTSEDIELIQKSFKTLDEPFCEPEVTAHFQQVSNLISPDTEYTHSMETRPFSKKVRISFSPALTLRSRGVRFWVNAYNRVIEELQAGESVPPNILSVIDEDYEDTGIEEEKNTFVADSFTNACLNDTIFPLPTNEAQRSIVKYLQKSAGILVTGPPGTGKSHSIVNLVSHFLASGKKVLITSQTTNALKVLKKKLPTEFQHLCVNVLGDDPASMASMKEAVADISESYSNWDRESAEKELELLSFDLTLAKSNIEKFEKDIEELLKSEFVEHEKLGYSGSFAEISHRLRAEAAKYHWVPPFEFREIETVTSREEMERYLHIVRRFRFHSSRDFIYYLPEVSTLSTPDEIKKLFQDLKKSERHIEKHATLMENPQWKLIRRADEQSLRAALDALQSVENPLRRATAATDSWVQELYRDTVKGHQSQWERMAVQIEEFVEACDRETALLAIPFERPVDLTLDQIRVHAEDLRDYLKEKGVPGFWASRFSAQKEAKYLYQTSLFNGRPITTLEQGEAFLAYLQLEKLLEVLQQSWHNHGETPEGNLLSLRNFFLGIGDTIRDFLALMPLLEKAGEAVSAVEASLIPDWLDADAFDLLQELLLLGVAHIDLDNLRNRKKQNHFQLENETEVANIHPLYEELFTAFCKENVVAYRDLYDKLLSLSTVQNEMLWAEELFRSVSDDMQKLLTDVREHCDETHWDERFAQWERAQSYALTKAWVHNSLAGERLRSLEEALQREQDTLLKLYTDFGSQLAWQHTLSRMRPSERQNLVAWAEAIKKIGKGTGKHAGRHRRNAREAMKKCRTAIPAWIMPLYRIVEIMTVTKHMFDVVIVDEASQCGPDSMLLYYIAKQCIVVGDDKQIAPESVGVNQEKVLKLAEKHLQGIPHQEHFDLQTSFYTHANIRFHKKVFLNEHFRCMPEIIEFSNQHFYGERLQCLKQYPANRLDPVKAVYVESGQRKDGSKYNIPEAHALVEYVEQICADPAYVDKSIGVISLLGKEQAAHIETLLLERISPEEIEERDIICGDAYSFQGDERDVILLSMVLDASSRTVGTDEKAGRRFNVAASRAREQMVLFHSIQPGQIGQSSYFSQLLNHCIGHSAHEDEIVSDIERGRCVTNLERDLFDALSERGFTVQSKYECGGIAIDLVVSGTLSRLAIQCEGDRWSGEKQLKRDMEKIAILKRCGWTFFHIHGADYYLDPEGVGATLFEKLRELGIEGGAEMHISHAENSNVYEE